MDLALTYAFYFTSTLPSSTPRSVICRSILCIGTRMAALNSDLISTTESRLLYLAASNLMLW